MWDKLRQFLEGGERQTAIRPPSGPRIGPRDIYSQDLPLNEEEFLSRNQSLSDITGDISSSPMGMVMSHMIPGQPGTIMGRVPKPNMNKIKNPARPRGELLQKIASGEMAQRIMKWLQREKEREWMQPGAMEESQRRIGNLIMNERMDASGKMRTVPDAGLDEFKGQQKLDEINKNLRIQAAARRRARYGVR